jgi:hypothetical protein
LLMIGWKKTVIVGAATSLLFAGAALAQNTQRRPDTAPGQINNPGQSMTSPGRAGTTPGQMRQNGDTSQSFTPPGQTFNTPGQPNRTGSMTKAR